MFKLKTSYELVLKSIVGKVQSIGEFIILVLYVAEKLPP